MAAVGFALALAALALGTVPTIGVVALIPASIGLVFSVIGLVQSRKTRQGKWLAVPGIVVTVAAAFWVPVASTLVPWLGASLSHISLGAAPAVPARTLTRDPAPPPPTRRFTPPPEPTQYSPPAMRRHAPAPASPVHAAAPAPDTDTEARREAERQVNEFVTRTRSESVEGWPADVESLRAIVDGLDNETEAASLHRTLDDAVVAVVESEAAAALLRATETQPAEGLRILDAFLKRAQAGATVAYATPLTPSVAAVSELRTRLAMQEDPAQRYAPRGVVGGARGLRVTLHDALTGENHVVAEGAALADGCTVVSIREEAREVTMTRAGKEYRLRW